MSSKQMMRASSFDLEKKFHLPFDLAQASKVDIFAAKHKQILDTRNNLVSVVSGQERKREL